MSVRHIVCCKSGPTDVIHRRCMTSVACAAERSDRCDATRAAGVLQPSFCPDTLRVFVYLSYWCVTHVLARVRPRPYENMSEFVGVKTAPRWALCSCCDFVLLYTRTVLVQNSVVNTSFTITAHIEGTTIQNQAVFSGAPNQDHQWRIYYFID